MLLPYANDNSGFSGGSEIKNRLQCRRHGWIPRSGKAPGIGNGNLLLHGKSYGQRSLAGYIQSIGVTKEWDMIYQLNNYDTLQLFVT